MTTEAARSVPEGYTVHTENSASILLPAAADAFLNPVQEFNRDISVACIRVWSEALNKSKEEKWREGLNKRSKKDSSHTNNKKARLDGVISCPVVTRRGGLLAVRDIAACS